MHQSEGLLNLFHWYKSIKQLSVCVSEERKTLAIITMYIIDVINPL